MLGKLLLQVCRPALPGTSRLLQHMRYMVRLSLTTALSATYAQQVPCERANQELPSLHTRLALRAHMSATTGPMSASRATTAEMSSERSQRPSLTYVMGNHGRPNALRVTTYEACNNSRVFVHHIVTAFALTLKKNIYTRGAYAPFRGRLVDPIVTLVAYLLASCEGFVLPAGCHQWTR